MEEKKPVSVGDIVAAMLMPAASNPPPADGDEPSGNPASSLTEARQITPPTSADMAAIQALANEAADLYDEIEELVGSRAEELSAKKAALRELLLNHGLKEVSVAGRPPIALNTKREKDSSKKAILAALGSTDGAKLWKDLPTKTSHYVSIPTRTPPGA